MTTTKQQLALEKAMIDSGPYPMEAYDFVEAGLEHTQERAFDDEPMLPREERHIRGQQLCLGLRDLAIARWGLMAHVVLRHWNVHRTDDFGRIVFALVDAQRMTKTTDDTIDDFRGVFDFDEAFSREALGQALVTDIAVD
jgi:uncharacterized repeat protein (TIGR04138 family)